MGCGVVLEGARKASHNLAEETLQITLPIAIGYGSGGCPPPPCARTARPLAGLVGLCPAKCDSSQG